MIQALFILAALLILALAGYLLVIAVRWAFRFPKAALILSTLLIAGCGIYYQHSITQHRLNFLPKGLPVDDILYANEEYWGWGPGANETGFIAYKLPDTAAQAILQGGIAYLERLSPGRSASGYYWHYEKWQETPILSDPHWLDNKQKREAITAAASPKIANYLNLYGFGIPIDPLIESELNTAIAKPKSYFAYGRIGIIIVIPDTRKVIYAYNG